MEFPKQVENTPNDQGHELHEDFRREVPQIYEETGMSADYRNEYVYFLYIIPRSGETIAEAYVNAYRRWGIHRYEERYPEAAYKDVLTRQNRSRVERLNQIVNSINGDPRYADPQRFPFEEFAENINKMELLISSVPRFIYQFNKETSRLQSISNPRHPDHQW